MKTPVSDELVIKIHKVIKKMGKISQQDYINLKACIKAEVWDREDVLAWAVHFSEDPWRLQNKEYKTVAHFLRDPERWMESKKPVEEKEWSL